jgi:uncharacterized short protein YbdD (DUF466 family)
MNAFDQQQFKEQLQAPQQSVLIKDNDERGDQAVEATTKDVKTLTSKKRVQKKPSEHVRSTQKLKSLTLEDVEKASQKSNASLAKQSQHASLVLTDRQQHPDRRIQTESDFNKGSDDRNYGKFGQHISSNVSLRQDN